MKRRRWCTWVMFLAAFMLAGGVSAGYAESPKRGGDIVSGYGQFPRHFNHGIQSGAATASPGTQIFAALVEIDQNFQPVPYLAKSWEIFPDPRPDRSSPRSVGGIRSRVARGGADPGASQ